MKSFYVWIKQFKSESNAMGDLSRDIISDDEFPKNKKLKSLLVYIKNKNASDECFSTLKESYQRYLDDVGLYAEGTEYEKHVLLSKRFGIPIDFINGIPVLKAVKRLDWNRGSRIYCVRCNYWHLHGISGERISHRVAHCGDMNNSKRTESPYHKRGYYLQVDFNDG